MQVFHDLYTYGCSDEISNIQFKNAEENIRINTYEYNRFNIIFLSSLIIFDGIVMIISRLFGTDKKVKEQLYIQMTMRTDNFNMEENLKLNKGDDEKKGEDDEKLKEKEINEETEKEKKETVKSGEFPEMDIDEKP